MNHKHKDGYVSTLGEDTRSVGLKLPKVVDEALTKAAAADFETKSAWARRIIVERLRADGLLPKAGEPS